MKQKQAAAGLTVIHDIGAEQRGYFNVRDNDGNVVTVNKEAYNKVIGADTDGDKQLSDEEIKAANITDEQLQLTNNLNIFEIDNDDIGGIQFDIETDINFLYEEMGRLQYGSPEYKMAKLRLEGILDQAPVLVQLLNKTTQDKKSAWNMDATDRDWETIL